MDKIICVGKNYLEHARELGDAVPEMPVLFLKPPSSLALFSKTHAEELELPKNRGAVHPECEIVVRIGQDRKSFDALTLGLDLTLRDEQRKLKDAGHPWEISKVFRNSAVIGPWILRDDFKNFSTEPFEFWVDSELRQTGSAQEMRLGLEECVQYAAKYFDLFPGDLIFTGTPKGVGPVNAGQTSKLKWGERLNVGLRWR